MQPIIAILNLGGIMLNISLFFCDYNVIFFTRPSTTKWMFACSRMTDLPQSNVTSCLLRKADIFDVYLHFK